MTTNQLNIMNNFNTKYVKILEILKQFETKSNFLNQIRCPRLSDIELIALDLTAESLGIDSEYQLFRVLLNVQLKFHPADLLILSWLFPLNFSLRTFISSLTFKSSILA